MARYHRPTYLKREPVHCRACGVATVKPVLGACVKCYQRHRASGVALPERRSQGQRGLDLGWGLLGACRRVAWL